MPPSTDSTVPVVALANKLARFLRIPQIKVAYSAHKRLVAIKYVIFILLFGFALYDMAVAEKMAEVEPFKTAIILKFIRDWPFTIFAVLLLIASLFIERFYCRYLCALGAALAWPMSASMRLRRIGCSISRWASRTTSLKCTLTSTMPWAISRSPRSPSAK